jgi:hypothetical protein
VSTIAEIEGAEMTVKPKKPMPHPDDLIVIRMSLTFQAELNPYAKDPPALDVTEILDTMSVAEAPEYLEKVVSAIRDRRLYGLMQQQAAEFAVGSGDWIEKLPEDLIAEATADDVGD